jgi:hypothetical protein
LRLENILNVSQGRKEIQDTLKLSGDPWDIQVHFSRRKSNNMEKFER